MRVEDIARVCHAAIREHSWVVGLPDTDEWRSLTDEDREANIDGVKYYLSSRSSVSPEASHDNWMMHMLKKGWRWGSVKCPEKMEHPCLVPYRYLPEDQRVKDVLFLNIVDALASNGVES